MFTLLLCHLHVLTLQKSIHILNSEQMRVYCSFLSDVWSCGICYFEGQNLNLKLECDFRKVMCAVKVKLWCHTVETYGGS
jgi:hypothetical protein